MLLPAGIPRPKVDPAGRAELPDLASKTTHYPDQLFLYGEHRMIRCNSDTH
jgi:hypothetical protein